MRDQVQQAFYIAAFERRPVVLGVPQDIQKDPAPHGQTYVPSSSVIPVLTPTLPDPDVARTVARKLAAAERPMIIAGRGAVRAGAGPDAARLAEASGALLATTLPARGLFDDDPFSVGVTGGYATQLTRELVRASDIVVAVGASLTRQATDSGGLLANALVVQIDDRPVGLWHGRRVADIYLRADACAGVRAVTDALQDLPARRSKVRSPALARRIEAESRTDAAAFEVDPGTLDPRDVIAALDRIIPKDWDIVSGAGHSSSFLTHMRGRRPENFHAIREFSAIGNALSFAVGVAVARGDGKVVVADGDGGLLMHVQELETIARHGIRLVICALNDGAFGAEIHKLRAEGIDASAGIFGRPDFASLARTFGLSGGTVSEIGQLDPLFRDYAGANTAAVWDVHISDKVLSAQMRRQTGMLPP
jgi:thiamine pyrophosphate-dependent acetolactate synthase large subunit-like protein